MRAWAVLLILLVAGCTSTDRGPAKGDEKDDGAWGLPPAGGTGGQNDTSNGTLEEEVETPMMIPTHADVVFEPGKTMIHARTLQWDQSFSVNRVSPAEGGGSGGQFRMALLFIEQDPECTPTMHAWIYPDIIHRTTLPAGAYHVYAWNTFGTGVLLRVGDGDEDVLEVDPWKTAPVDYQVWSTDGGEDPAGFQEPVEGLGLIMGEFSDGLVETGYDWSYEVQVDDCLVAEAEGTRGPVDGFQPAFEAAADQTGNLTATFEGDMDWSITRVPLPSLD